MFLFILRQKRKQGGFRLRPFFLSESISETLKKVETDRKRLFDPYAKFKGNTLAAEIGCLTTGIVRQNIRREGEGGLTMGCSQHRDGLA